MMSLIRPWKVNCGHCGKIHSHWKLEYWCFGKYMRNSYFWRLKRLLFGLSPRFIRRAYNESKIEFSIWSILAFIWIFYILYAMMKTENLLAEGTIILILPLWFLFPSILTAFWAFLVYSAYKSDGKNGVKT